jgi:alkanesulfonate monooxygenase
MPLKFHWRLLQGGDDGAAGAGAAGAGPEPGAAAALPDLDAQIDFCRTAEECGIDSLLVDINSGKPDPMGLAMALGLATRTMRFMVAHRPGLMSPTLFVQQVNTFAALTGGRISLNVVAGHSPQEQRSYGDFLSHDERYERMDEYLEVCHAFWDQNGPVSFRGKYLTIEDGRLNTPFMDAKRSRPEIFLGGSSAPARQVAARRASCWVRFADTPEGIRAQGLPDGVETGLRLSVLVRPTREEAVRDARRLLTAGATPARRSNEAAFVQGSDASGIRDTLRLAEREWLTPCLWAGAVPVLGATSLALVGTPDDVAEALLEYGRAGVSQFILSGWPKRGEMIRFAADVLPRVRAAEGAGEGVQCPS